MTQGNLACTYRSLGRLDEALALRRDVYSGNVKYLGEEHRCSLIEAYNYANCLVDIRRFDEVKSLMRKTIHVARRVRGESNELTLKMRSIYAVALYKDESATLDDLNEAVTTLEDAERIARRVLGSAHPTVASIGPNLRRVRAALRARETPSPPGSA